MLTRNSKYIKGLKLFGKDLSSTLVKDTMIYMFGSGIQRAMGILLLPLYLNVLTPDDNGVIEIGNNIISIFFILFSFCLHQAIFIEYYHFEENKRIRLFQQASAGYIIFSLPLYLIGFIILFFFNKSIIGVEFSVIALICVTTFSFLQFFQIIFLQELRFQRKSLKSTIFTTCVGLATAFTNILLVYYLKWGVNGVFIGNLLALCLVLIYIFYYFRKSLFFKVDFKEIFRLIAIGSPLIISGISYWLFTGANNQILVRTLGANNLGLYSIAIKFVIVFQPLLIQPFINAYTPHLFKKFSEGKIYFPYKILSLSAIIFFILLGFVIKFAAGFIVVQQDYLDVLWLIPILMPGMAFVFIVNIMVLPMIYHKKTKQIVLNIAIAGIVCMVSCFFLSRLFGLLGAAIAYLIGNAVWALATIWQTKCVIKKIQHN
ncbi:MAG TPA: oligosaccharide flippase family protein [Bacteroidales bacterium]|nr:oligosaccharide flippase family protein [Bacteroidales bacterium]